MTAHVGVVHPHIEISARYHRKKELSFAASLLAGLAGMSASILYLNHATTPEESIKEIVETRSGAITSLEHVKKHRNELLEGLGGALTYKPAGSAVNLEKLSLLEKQYTQESIDILDRLVETYEAEISSMNSDPSMVAYDDVLERKKNYGVPLVFAGFAVPSLLGFLNIQRLESNRRKELAALSTPN